MTDGYVTIDTEVEEQHDVSVTDLTTTVKVSETPNQVQHKSLSNNHGIPYKAIFNDLDTVFDEITQEMCSTKSKQFSDKIRDEEIKIKKGAALSGLDQDICASGKGDKG